MLKSLKWVYAHADLLEGKGTCSECKSHNLDYGYIALDNNSNDCYGAVWCNDCLHGYYLSRINPKSKEKLITEPPAGIKFN
jgi:hypothetical protein